MLVWSLPLLVTLAFVALLLLPTTRDPLPPWFRTTLWLAALVVLALVGFLTGTAHFEVTQCRGAASTGECDVAVVEGLLWAVGGVALVAAAWLIDAFRRSR